MIPRDDVLVATNLRREYAKVVGRFPNRSGICRQQPVNLSRLAFLHEGLDASMFERLPKDRCREACGQVGIGAMPANLAIRSWETTSIADVCVLTHDRAAPNVFLGAQEHVLASEHTGNHQIKG